MPAGSWRAGARDGQATGRLSDGCAAGRPHRVGGGGRFQIRGPDSRAARGRRLQGRARQIQPNLTTVDDFHLRYSFPPLAQGGIEALKQVRFRQPQSELQEHKTTLEAHFREHPPTSITQATHVIEQLTGIKRSEVQVGIFLKKMGMKRLKTCAIPAKCDVDEQEAFKKKS